MAFIESCILVYKPFDLERVENLPCFACEIIGVLARGKGRRIREGVGGQVVDIQAAPLADVAYGEIGVSLSAVDNGLWCVGAEIRCRPFEGYVAFVGGNAADGEVVDCGIREGADKYETRANSSTSSLSNTENEVLSSTDAEELEFNVLVPGTVAATVPSALHSSTVHSSTDFMPTFFTVAMKMPSSLGASAAGPSSAVHCRSYVRRSITENLSKKVPAIYAW